jgi:aspartate racemase
MLHQVNNSKVIGIVGGMGPQAGAALLQSIICQTDASLDQQHLPVILMSFPGHIVDRTAFLEGKTDVNPAYAISGIIHRLESSGAGVIAMACNTSHAPEIFDVIIEELDRIRSRVNIVHLPLAACSYIRNDCPQLRRIGLMTTNGTWKSGVYRNILRNWGYEVVIPDFSFQNDVIHRMVYDPKFGIKANPVSVQSEVMVLAEKAIAFFEDRRTEAIILGCTEFSMIISGKAVKGMRIIDSIEISARALIREATGFEEMGISAGDRQTYLSGK